MVEVEERLHSISLLKKTPQSLRLRRNRIESSPFGAKYQAIFLLAKIGESCGFATEEYSTRLESEEGERLRIIPEEEATRLKAKESELSWIIIL